MHLRQMQNAEGINHEKMKHENRAHRLIKDVKRAHRLIKDVKIIENKALP